MRLVSDFSDRMIQLMETVLGQLAGAEKQAARSYFIRQGQDKARMADSDYRKKYDKQNLNWIPEVVKRYYNL